MQFSNIIGQTGLKKQLIDMVSSGRMPHAQIFLGPEGSGKLSLALAYAQFVLCEDRQETDACGRCSNCIKSAKYIHPDIHFSYPTIGSKVTSTQFLTEWRSALEDNPYLNVNQWLALIGAENKQGNINKEECVSIIKKLSLKAFEGKYKILIMWLPEYLGKEGNRLLKLIEEPPENTLFILVAENQDLILNTILSRCQLVKINQLSDDIVIDGLLNKNLVTEENAAAIAHLANGNFNEAILLANETENDNAKLFLDWMRKCYKGNGVELVKWVDKFATIGRENQKHFLKYGLHFMREYMIMRMTGKQEIRLQQAELKTAQNLSKVIGFDQIENIVQLFNDCSFYVERNANPKILFLDASIKMNHILKMKVAA